jgi:hypothetical protein
MSKKEEIIILGGGQAAAYAAKEIRATNNQSNLTIEAAKIFAENIRLIKNINIKLFINKFKYILILMKIR